MRCTNQGARGADRHATPTLRPILVGARWTTAEKGATVIAMKPDREVPKLKTERSSQSWRKPLLSRVALSATSSNQGGKGDVINLEETGAGGS
jgi:hypothetical protein